MKRTTYIFIGIFCANIVLVLGFAFYVKSVLRITKPLTYNFDMVQNPGSVDMNDVHTLEFFISGVDSKEYYFADPGRILLTSSGSEENCVMSYPVSDYLKLEKKDGVLSITLDLPLPATLDSSKDGKNTRRSERIDLQGLDIRITGAKTLTKISSGTGFEVKLHRLELDSLYLNSKDCQVDSCAIRSLVLDGRRLNMRASQCTYLSFDLDKTNWWDIKESKINTLHLTGSKHYQNRLSADQYNRLIWEPKGDKAKLDMSLRSKSEVIMN